MIQLNPIPSVQFDCPVCGSHLKATGSYMPGMRVLATLECPQCGHGFYGDLPTGQGLFRPVLLDSQSGAAYSIEPSWFLDEIKQAYMSRSSIPLDLKVETLRSLKNPYLLNCLDTYYGHCLEKLFNAQHYIDSGVDLLIIVPAFLRWLVPDGAAEIWTVKVPLRQNAQWSDWFAEQMRARMETLEQCALAVAFPEPNSEDINIERFTRVKPFPLDEWFDRLDKPTVTFIWRTDRLWPELPSNRWLRGGQKILRRIGLVPSRLQVQAHHIDDLACRLKALYPGLDFAVVGIGQPGDFDDWVHDLRSTKIDDQVERSWCERYAASHIIIGIHGSNMLLPSALAGSVIELLPTERYGNLGQDIFTAGSQTSREIIFRYRFLPANAPLENILQLVSTLLDQLPDARLHFARRWNDYSLIETNPNTLSLEMNRLKVRTITQKTPKS